MTVSDAPNWRGITVTRTPGQHGSGAVLEDMGSAPRRGRLGFRLLIPADGERLEL